MELSNFLLILFLTVNTKQDNQNRNHVYCQVGLTLIRNLLWCGCCFRGTAEQKEGSNCTKNPLKSYRKVSDVQYIPEG